MLNFYTVYYKNVICYPTLSAKDMSEAKRILIDGRVKFDRIVVNR